MQGSTQSESSPIAQEIGIQRYALTDFNDALNTFLASQSKREYLGACLRLQALKQKVPEWAVAMAMHRINAHSFGRLKG